MTFVESIKDKWLTWRTGRNKSEREYYEWQSQNIVKNARDVTNYFQGFKYIIAVDYAKVNTKFDPLFGCMESDDFLNYLYPQKPLGQNCACGIFRGEWNQWDHRFHLNDFGFDQMFVATNSEEDAVMIALKWS